MIDIKGMAWTKHGNQLYLEHIAGVTSRTPALVARLRMKGGDFDSDPLGVLNSPYTLATVMEAVKSAPGLKDADRASLEMLLKTCVASAHGPGSHGRGGHFVIGVPCNEPPYSELYA